MTRRAWVVAGLVVVLVVGGTAGWRLTRDRHTCGDTVTSIPGSRSSSPFLDAAGRKQQPDAQRDRAVASLGSAPAPFGPVVGAVGYDYEQWAQISAYDQGIGIRTRDNPDFTMLDDHTLEPRWSVQVSTKRSTYDASAQTYLVATLPRKGTPDLVALDASTGARRWCATLAGPHVGGSDPFATEMLDDGGVVVLGPGKGHLERVVRLDSHGRRLWAREVDADEGDYLGLLGKGLLLVGGRPDFQLQDPRGLGDRLSSVRALDLGSGHTVWKAGVAKGTGEHVVGLDDGVAVVLHRDTSDGAQQLLGLDTHGTQAWSLELPTGSAVDATVRAGRVVVRRGSLWTAYDASSGRALWRRTLPTSPQLLPYGFQLDDVPLLDDTHALVGTTTGLRVLDLRTGVFTVTAPLPTDGINTTYWPYAVAVSPHLIAVATNTSAVVSVRRPEPAQ
jgi:outer membrane protein assembly factor BamB